jgi:hypothetical protein
MNRFFLYEEYGAKYEMMIKDIASAYRTIPQWEVYQRGLEALASSLSSLNSQLDGNRKALTVGDLLVKVVSFWHGFFWVPSDHIPANSASLQVSTIVCRTFETNTCL